MNAKKVKKKNVQIINSRNSATQKEMVEEKKIKIPAHQQLWLKNNKDE